MKITLLKTVAGLFMKLCFAFSLVCILAGVATANVSMAQHIGEVQVTLKNQVNTSLTDVLAGIEKQTPFRFVYNKDLENYRGKVTIPESKLSVEDLLKKISKQIPLNWKQIDKTIALSLSPPRKPVKITGTVTDAGGQTLPGVTVMVKGAGISVTSDSQGQFSVHVPDENDVLIFSYIGFRTKEIRAGNNTVLRIVLEADSKILNDVLVIGYGSQSRRKLTGAVSKVPAKELNRYQGSSFATQLAGKAPGVIINDNSAQPGTDPQIVIRGIGTLTAGRDPLVVIDGFPLSEGTSFNSVNPADIESVEILKDPASAAIYGSRAANGVILITTKKGKQEAMKLSVDIYTGVQQRADNIEYVDAYQAAEYFTEARDWGYVSKNPANRSVNDSRATRVTKGASLRELRLNYLAPYLNNEAGLTNTDWLKETFRNAPISSYNLAVSGGTPKGNYYFSANYFDQQGLVIENGLKRYSGAVKLNSKVSEKLDFGLSLNPSYTTQNYFNNNGNNNTDPIGATNIMYPFFSPYNEDGTLAVSKQIIANTPEDGALGESTVALAKMITNVRNNFRSFGNAYLQWNLIDGLKIKSLLGGDYRNSYQNYYNPSNVGGYRTAAPKPAAATENNGYVLNYLSENTLEFARRFGSHDINFLAGYSYQKQSGSGTDIQGSSIADDNITNIGGANAFSVTTSKYTWTQVSWLSRLQYAYKDKYLLSGTIRKDGSSRFGKNNRWGYFPSVTSGWVVSSEDFFPRSSVLTFTKLRATWGRAGNNQVGSYASRVLFQVVTLITTFLEALLPLVLQPRLLRMTSWDGKPKLP